MERLTRQGIVRPDYVLLNVKCKHGSKGTFCKYAPICERVNDRSCPVLSALDKLLAYEDTNLEPAEILSLKQENERLRAELTLYKMNPNIKHNQQYIVTNTSEPPKGEENDK